MSKEPDFGAVTSAADLLAIARVMEERSAERYREMAEAFEISCNPDTAQAFRDLAAAEDRHAADFPAVDQAPRVMPWGEEDPEIADPDQVHYLMHPWHAYDLARRHEEKALAFFSVLAERSPHADVRAEALRMVERERAHVDHMIQCLAELPVPPKDWWLDEDGPNWEAGD